MSWRSTRVANGLKDGRAVVCGPLGQTKHLWEGTSEQVLGAHGGTTLQSKGRAEAEAGVLETEQGQCCWPALNKQEQE